MLATAVRDTGIPLSERHLELSDRERPGGGPLPLGPLFLVAVILGFFPKRRDPGRARAHHEPPRRHHNHLGANIAFPETVLGLERPLFGHRERTGWAVRGI